MERLKKLFNLAVKQPIHSGLIAFSLTAAAAVPFVPLPQKQATISSTENLTRETLTQSPISTRENFIDRMRRNNRDFIDRDANLLARLKAECTPVNAETLPHDSESNRIILANAVAKQIYKCELPLPKIKNGEFQPCQGTIFLNSALFETEDPLKAEEVAIQNELTKIHEAFHALQNTHGALSFYHSWDLQSRAIHTLSFESAAFAFSTRVVFEAHLAGDNKLYDYLTTKLPKNHYNVQNLMLFERTYLEQTEQGTPSAEALDRASYAVWKNFFTQKARRDAYHVSVIFTYISSLYGEQGEFHKKIEPTDLIPLIKKTGYINEKASLTRFITPADLENIFGANDEMRKVFGAVEFQRYQMVYGADDPRTRERKTAALADQNPYLELDFKLALLHFSQAEGDLKFIDIVKGVQDGSFTYESLPSFDPAMKNPNYVITPINIALHGVDLNKPAPLNKACFVKYAHINPASRKP